MSVKFKFAVGAVTLFEFLLAGLFLFYTVGPWIDRAVIPFTKSRVEDSLLFGALAGVGIFVSVQLFRGRRWAWWTANAVSAVLLFGSAWLGWLSLHPRDAFARSEAGAGIGLSVLLLTPSTLCLILLNLPLVRRELFASRFIMSV